MTALMTERDLQSAMMEARTIIDRLPQRELVPDERIEKWLSVMAARDPERIVWHALRQSGFSGSEVGTLVTNRRGHRAHFGSARKLVMQKLFMMTPDMPNEHMQRGLETEELHRQKFMQMWNAQRDERAFQALSEARGRYPFLRYSPDDVVTIDGRRVLTDYKAPSDVADEAAYDFEYQCQINLGADILSHIGMPADHGLLSRLSWKEWRCACVWVQIDLQLQEEIQDAAHHYWTEHVLRGEAPDYVATHKVPELSPGLKHQLRLLSARVVALDEVSNKLADEREAVCAAMKELTKKAAVRPGKVLAFCHDIKTTHIVNLDHFCDMVASINLDPEEEIRKVTGRIEYDEKRLLADIMSNSEIDKSPYFQRRVIDNEKAIERLKELGLDPDVAVDISVDIRKSTKKKLEDVNAFRPQFTRVGEELKSRVVMASLMAMGEAPVLSTPEPPEDDHGDAQRLIG